MKLSQTSFVGTLVVMLAFAKRICEVYATSTRLLEKTNPTRALESEYPPRVRRPQFAETLVGTTSRAGKPLPALVQRPHRLQSITVVASSPTSGSEEPAVLSLQNSTRKGTAAPSGAVTETRHADFRHLNAYDNGLADALEVIIAARNERNYRPGSHRRLPTTVPSISRFARSKQAATAQAAVSELTLTPVSGRQELLQLFMDDAPDIPRDTWREILLFRLGRVQESGESDGGATPSTRVRSPVDRVDES